MLSMTEARTDSYRGSYSGRGWGLDDASAAARASELRPGPGIWPSIESDAHTIPRRYNPMA
jgi:hypothetical protein